MNKNLILLVPVLLPVIAGIVLAFPKIFPDRKARWWFVCAVCAVELVFVFCAAGSGYELTLARFNDRLAFVLRPDALSLLFGGLCSIMWLSASIFSEKYFSHGKDERMY
ncbi:MAG: hypothetical protein K2O71_07125, partial [Lachnospiraceae bacterium]|nr:hypothetical protein [Lachnospiraceae bacterium]